MRHTVGGAQREGTPVSHIVSRSARELKRPRFGMRTVASAFQGAKKQLQACFAQPGDETLQCISPGRSPIQYMVERCPTGYVTCECSTSLGFDVVPEVK